MSSTSLRRLLSHPLAVAIRLVLWPAVVLVSGEAAARAQGDALAAGLTAFAVIAVLAFVLALADGLVLRTRSLTFVWAVTTIVVAGLLVAKPMLDVLADGASTGSAAWIDAVHVVGADLPASLVFFVGLVIVPVVLGAVAGVALRRSTTAPDARAGRTPGVGTPRA